MSDVSITDIARAAGVSPSTVSRALQNHPRISPQRRDAIQALAREMGYRPSQVARSLVTGKTRTLGVVVTDVTDPFVAEVMKGAEAASREGGYGLLFAMSNRDPQQEIESVQMLIDRQVDGMIVISSRASDRYRDMWEKVSKAPLVLVNNEQAGSHLYSVRMDNTAGAREAAGYLRGLGHRRISFVAGPPGGRSSRERLEGYRQGLASGGGADAEARIVAGSGRLEDGPPALAALMRLSPPPTAVMCYNDLSAIGLLAAATAAGLRVPADLSVVGYDNIPLSTFTMPPLTTVDQPKQALGRRAVAMCLSALANETVAGEVLEGQLIVRASAAPPADRA